MYNGSTQYSNTGYTLELSHSNMTKCCNYLSGGGIWLKSLSRFSSVTMLFSYLVLSQNQANRGGGLAVELQGYGNVTLDISNCLFARGSGLLSGGGMYFSVNVRSWITIESTNLVENIGHEVSEIRFFVNAANVVLSLLNSAIVHTETHSYHGVLVRGCCSRVVLNKTRMTFANQHTSLFLRSFPRFNNTCMLHMVDSQFEGSHNMYKSIIHLNQARTAITNCTFSNNTGTVRSSQFFRHILTVLL